MLIEMSPISTAQLPRVAMKNIDPTSPVERLYKERSFQMKMYNTGTDEFCIELIENFT